MTDSTAGSEPRTAAGRALRRDVQAMIGAEWSMAADRELGARIAAIEAEARSLAPESEWLRAVLADCDQEAKAARRLQGGYPSEAEKWKLYAEGIELVLEKVRAALNPESETGSAR